MMTRANKYLESHFTIGYTKGLMKATGSLPIVCLRLRHIVTSNSRLSQMLEECLNGSIEETIIMLKCVSDILILESY